MKLLRVISLVFKDILVEVEVKALTSIPNESSRLDRLTDATNTSLFRDQFVVFMVIVAFLVTIL